MMSVSFYLPSSWDYMRKTYGQKLGYRICAILTARSVRVFRWEVSCAEGRYLYDEEEQEEEMKRYKRLLSGEKERG